MDGQTDGQSETNIPPSTLLVRGIIMATAQNLHWNRQAIMVTAFVVGGYV